MACRLEIFLVTQLGQSLACAHFTAHLGGNNHCGKICKNVVTVRIRICSALFLLVWKGRQEVRKERNYKMKMKDVSNENTTWILSISANIY